MNKFVVSVLSSVLLVGCMSPRAEMNANSNLDLGPGDNFTFRVAAGSEKPDAAREAMWNKWMDNQLALNGCAQKQVDEKRAVVAVHMVGPAYVMTYRGKCLRWEEAR